MLLAIRESVFGYYAHESFKATSPEMAKLEPSVPKPSELSLLESLTNLGMKFTDGGYVQQPWLLLKSLEAAAAGKGMFYDQQIRVDRAESVG